MGVWGGGGGEVGVGAEGLRCVCFLCEGDIYIYIYIYIYIGAPCGFDGGPRGTSIEMPRRQTHVRARSDDKVPFVVTPPTDR